MEWILGAGFVVVFGLIGWTMKRVRALEEIERQNGVEPFGDFPAHLREPTLHGIADEYERTVSFQKTPAPDSSASE